MDPEFRLYRVRAAIDILGISKATFFRHVAAGKIRTVKIGRATRVPAESLREYVAGLPTPE